MIAGVDVWRWWERGRCACSCDCAASVRDDAEAPRRCAACEAARDQEVHRPTTEETREQGEPDELDDNLAGRDPLSYAVDLDRLEAVARAATAGPWWAEPDVDGADCGRACTMDGCGGHPIRGVATLEGPDVGAEVSARGDRRALAWVRDGGHAGRVFLERDANFMAAWHPGVALALVAQLRRLEAAVDALAGCARHPR